MPRRNVADMGFRSGRMSIKPTNDYSIEGADITIRKGGYYDPAAVAEREREKVQRASTRSRLQARRATGEALSAEEEAEIAAIEAAELAAAELETAAARVTELKRRQAAGQLTAEEAAELLVLEKKVEAAAAAARIGELERRQAAGELNAEETAELLRLQEEAAKAQDEAAREEATAKQKAEAEKLESLRQRRAAGELTVEETAELAALQAQAEAAAAVARVAELRRRQEAGELTPEEEAELGALERQAEGAAAAARVAELRRREVLGELTDEEAAELKAASAEAEAARLVELERRRAAGELSAAELAELETLRAAATKASIDELKRRHAAGELSAAELMAELERLEKATAGGGAAGGGAAGGVAAGGGEAAASDVDHDVENTSVSVWLDETSSEERDGEAAQLSAARATSANGGLAWDELEGPPRPLTSSAVLGGGRESLSLYSLSDERMAAIASARASRDQQRAMEGARRRQAAEAARAGERCTFAEEAVRAVQSLARLRQERGDQPVVGKLQGQLLARHKQKVRHAGSRVGSSADTIHKDIRRLTALCVAYVPKAPSRVSPRPGLHLPGSGRPSTTASSVARPHTPAAQWNWQLPIAHSPPSRVAPSRQRPQGAGRNSRGGLGGDHGGRPVSQGGGASRPCSQPAASPPLGRHLDRHMVAPSWLVTDEPSDAPDATSASDAHDAYADASCAPPPLSAEAAPHELPRASPQPGGASSPRSPPRSPPRGRRASVEVANVDFAPRPQPPGGEGAGAGMEAHEPDALGNLNFNNEESSDEAHDDTDSERHSPRERRDSTEREQIDHLMRASTKKRMQKQKTIEDMEAGRIV